MIRGELARRAERLSADRVPFAVATAVRAQHPTSAHAGDSALVLADGTIEGFVGGVCAESSVRLQGLRVLETGVPVVLRLEPDVAEDADSVDSGAGEVVVRNPCLSGGSLEILLEPILPAPRVNVVGTAPIARALAELARAGGYDVFLGEAERVHPQTGDAATIVASHGRDEERVLAEALAAGVPYVALVASETRGAAVRAALDVPDELRAQLHTPAGLDIGAETPEEIAVAILAQLVAERHAHPARAATTVAAAAPAASATDPVCGMEVAVSEATPHLDIGSERAFFCSERCRDSYAEQHLHDAAAR